MRPCCDGVEFAGGWAMGGGVDARTGTRAEETREGRHVGSALFNASGALFNASGALDATSFCTSDCVRYDTTSVMMLSTRMHAPAKMPATKAKVLLLPLSESMVCDVHL
jgi:hypothetical protein